jgi:hypothetical protein
MDIRQRAIEKAAQDLIAYRYSDVQPDQRIHLESMCSALDLGFTPQEVEAEVNRQRRA